VNLADAHLKYVGTFWRDTPALARGFSACYAVHARADGRRLGYAFKTYGVWTAVPAEDALEAKRATTRWEAAIAVWPGGGQP
jgi:hypothetical protein